MIDKYAVELATEYVEKQFATGKSADLVGMLNHVGYFERVVMVLDEVNEQWQDFPRFTFSELMGESSSHNRLVTVKSPT